MKKINKFLMPVLTVAGIGSCIVPLVACSATKYSVTVNKHAGVSIECGNTAVYNQDFSFKYEILPGYEIDEEKSYITIGGDRLYQGYYILDNYVTIPGDKVTGNIIINLIVKQEEVEYFDVICRQHANVTVEAPSIALINQNYTFNFVFDEGYEYDKANSYIKIGTKEAFRPDLTGKSYTIPAEYVNGTIEIVINAMASQHTVTPIVQPANLSHIRDYYIPSGATYGYNLSGTITVDPFYQITDSDAFYVINSKTYQLEVKHFFGNEWTFTIPGEVIKGDVYIGIQATPQEGFSLTKDSNITDAYLTLFEENQPAYIYTTLKDGYMLNDSHDVHCEIKLGATTLTTGIDYLVNNDSIVIKADAVNNYLQGEDTSITISLVSVESITVEYDAASTHFVSDEGKEDKFNQAPVAGQHLVFNFANRGGAETGWYGVEKGYVINPDPENTIIKVNDEHLTYQTDYIIDEDLSQIIINGNKITANAKISIKIDTKAIEPEMTEWTYINGTKITTPDPLVTCDKVITKTAGTPDKYTFNIEPAEGITQNDVKMQVAIKDTFWEKSAAITVTEDQWDGSKWVVDITNEVEPGSTFEVTCKVVGQEITANDAVVTGDLPAANIIFASPNPQFNEDLVYSYTLNDITDEKIMIDKSQIFATYQLMGETSPTTITDWTLERTTTGGKITIPAKYVKYGATFNLTVNADKAWHIDPSTNVGGVKFVAEADTAITGYDVNQWISADYFDSTLTDDFEISNVIVESPGTALVNKVQLRWNGQSPSQFEYIDVPAGEFAYNPDTRIITISKDAFEGLRTAGTGGTRVTNFYIYVHFSAQ